MEITIKRDSSGEITNLESFNRDVLSVIHYLAKYPYSYLVAKQGHKISKANILYASLTEIFSQDFIETNFGGTKIGGKLTQYALDNYEKWQNGYFDEHNIYHPGWNQNSEHWASSRKLWSWENTFPVYIFRGANSPTFGDNDFAEFLVNLFSSLSGDKSRKYSDISEILKLKVF